MACSQDPPRNWEERLGTYACFVSLISQWLESLQMHPSVIVGVVAVQGHWIPFMWNWTSAGLTASSWDVSGTLPTVSECVA